MYQIHFTTPAEEDLVSLLRYIADILKAPTAAETFLNGLEGRIKSLSENPYIFPLAKDEYLGRHGIRRVQINNYLLFYTIEKDAETISIIRILYARRDWMHLMEEEATE